MVSLDRENEFYDQVFSGLNYSTKKIVAKVFEGCSFESCDFSEATFSQCEFTDCKFVKCNLSVLKVGNSKFTEVVFEDCKLLAVDWSKAYWRGLTLGAPLAFRKCMMNSSSFYALNLAQMLMEECKVHDVDFREANFSGANFSYTDFTNSLFSHTNLTGANFDGAINYDININNNVVKNAIFSRSEATRLLETLDINLID